MQECISYATATFIELSYPDYYECSLTQALCVCVCVCFAVNYFENNRAGITVFGFMLDRSTLHTIFGIELSLVLWLLGKTIGIS